MKSLTKEVTIINQENILFPILPNGKGWISTENEKMAVIESGEGGVLFSKILKLIDKAKKTICLQSFLVQDSEIFDALVNAVKVRNVKVYILSSAEARLKETIEYEEDFIKPRYIELLESKFKNNFVHRVAENFHAKYILIDPTTKPQGFLCTSNFTYNGFFKSPELAVELSTIQVTELFKVFVYHFWEFATHEQTAGNEFERVYAAKKFELVKNSEILLTSPDKDICSLNEKLVSTIKTATKSVSVSTYILHKDQELVQALVQKASEGIKVTLFCRPMDWLYNDHLKDLVGRGINVIMHPLMHGKSLLIDESMGFIFTANLIENGLLRGLEVGIQLTDVQVKDLLTIHQAWSKNFPLKINMAAAKNELSRIFEFNKEGRLVEVELIEEEKEIERKVNTVSELISFYTNGNLAVSKWSKQTKFRLVARIEKLPERFKPVGADSLEVIEYENERKDKKALLAIKDSFNTQELEKLKEHINLNIFVI